MLTVQMRQDLSRLYEVESIESRRRGDIKEAVRLMGISAAAHDFPPVKWGPPPPPPPPPPAPPSPCGPCK